MQDAEQIAIPILQDSWTIDPQQESFLDQQVGHQTAV